jgi:hypothetical protein
MNRIVAMGALIFAVSPGFAHRVRVDFDHAARFSAYKTYSWAPPAAQESDQTLFPNQLMRARVAGFIEEAMAARGYRRVKSGGDLVLSYQIKVTEQPQYVTFYDSPGGGCGWGWGNCAGWGGWGTGWATTTFVPIYRGTLVVDLVDANKNRLVFQGTSTHTISSRPERNTRKLAKAVGEVFEKYPPQK